MVPSFIASCILCNQIIETQSNELFSLYLHARKHLLFAGFDLAARGLGQRVAVSGVEVCFGGGGRT